MIVPLVGASWSNFQAEDVVMWNTSQRCFSVFSILKMCFRSHFLPRIFLHYLPMRNMNEIWIALHLHCMHTSLSHYLKSSLLPLWKEKGKSQNKMFSLFQPSNFMPNQILNFDHVRQLSHPVHRNMAYIVYYIYCHNAILARHAAIHTDASKAKTFQEVIKYLNRKRYKPSLKMRDNACFKADEAYINEKDVNIQFDSPRNYRLNAA